MSTAADEVRPLFKHDLISPQVAASLPEGYTCRPLQSSDYHDGFLDVLRVLTTVGDISEAQWAARFEEMLRTKDTYYLICIANREQKVVGTGALIVEKKLYLTPPAERVG